MRPFNFCIPTEMIYGKGRVKEAGEQVKLRGDKVLLLSYDKMVLEQIGIYEQIHQSLSGAGVRTVEHLGVKSNPDVAHAREGIRKVLENGIGVILAVGGGSVMDEGKCIAAGALYDGDVWDLYEGKGELSDALPLVTICTIPATSSEMNCISVMNNEETKQKSALSGPEIYPRASILDPVLTYGIPIRNTAYSAADIISHLSEAYFTGQEHWTPIQDGYCESLMRTVMECMECLLENPKDVEARDTMMWAASISWNEFYRCGLGKTYVPCHILSHPLSGRYDTPHGAAISIVTTGWMRYMLDKKDERLTGRFAKFARQVFGIRMFPEAFQAQLGMKALQEWYRRIGVPASFKEGGIPTREVDLLVEAAYVDCLDNGIEDEYNKTALKAMYEYCF